MQENLVEKFSCPHVDLLLEAIYQKNPYHINSLKKTLRGLESAELHDLEEYLLLCQRENLSIEYMAHCYETIMADVLRESIYFKEHQHYRYSSFSEVANSVYYNDEYMSLYMHGLLITLFFWPNHLKLYRFFRDSLPKNKAGSYLEIGFGHGYFLMTALRSTAYSYFFGIDLSETSLRQTQMLTKNKQQGKEVTLYCADFLNFDFKPASYDAIVMGELLEHVENPADFLKKIAFIATEDTYIFVSTCLNAPAIDHIYQFTQLEQLTRLFAQSGLQIKEQCILPYVNKTIEECFAQLLAINVGYVLEKIR